MKIKETSSLLFSILILFISLNTALALFDTENLFGITMPSVGLAIDREATSKSEADQQVVETYDCFTISEYIEFGRYLAGINAKVENYTEQDDDIEIIIAANDQTMNFVYNWKEQIAVVTYSPGTRPETEKMDISSSNSILPAVKGIMPSVEFAINRKPDKIEFEDNSIIHVFNSFSDDDYSLFNSYLGETGAILKSEHNDNGIYNAQIELNEDSIYLLYDWINQNVKITYPEGTLPEETRRIATSASVSVLPDIKSIGVDLPSLSQALKRTPSFSETKLDGSYVETYSEFTEQDYNVFSQYLLKSGCSVSDYHMTDNLLIINLTNVSGQLQFIFDAEKHEATVVYPTGSRIEALWTPPPTPTPTPTPKPTASPDRLSEAQCWEIAEDYFLTKIKWNNPQSVTIYSHSGSYSDGAYLFSIDYSAMNKLGGFNRDTYWISVDVYQGIVLYALSN